MKVPINVPTLLLPLTSSTFPLQSRNYYANYRDRLPSLKKEKSSSSKKEKEDGKDGKKKGKKQQETIKEEESDGAPRRGPRGAIPKRKHGHARAAPLPTPPSALRSPPLSAPAPLSQPS